MFEKFKKIFFQGTVLVVNTLLVLGGVFFIKNQQAKKQDIQDLTTNKAINDAQGEVATQAAQLQQIVEQNKTNKVNTAAKNTGTVTVQKPVTVTQTIPAKTQTVQVPASSSSTSSTPAPKATTKKS